MSDWSVEKSSELYGIDYWGGGFFTVNDKGNVVARTSGTPNSPELDLFELTNELRDRGIRLPLIVRFPDIINTRISYLNRCFNKAITEYGYKGSYKGVYPIKVNQQSHLVREMMRFGQDVGMGLECGSKPELLVVLTMIRNPNSVIVCNGYKDSEYIETALLSLKLGRNTIIVVDRMDELPLIITASRKLGIPPKIGFRVKLNSQGAGKWVDSSGARSKFGLTTMEIFEGIRILQEAKMLENLELLHFHIGSQIPSIRSIKTSLKEASRFYVELHRMGAQLKYIDVGGGLGVDYDGSGAGDNSVNYSTQEYANDVVSIVQGYCDEKGVPHPDIITESGRFLTAHHSVLIYNVRGVNRLTDHMLPEPMSEKNHVVLKELQYIYDNMNAKNLHEYYNDLMQTKDEVLQLFTYGVLTLEERAWAEKMYWVSATKMVGLCDKAEDTEELKLGLLNELSDTYFCNFSVFQSMPDHWAMGQVFPVMPIHRLEEKPTRRAILVDLTCDSDGKIDGYLNIENGTTKETLEVHDVVDSEDYFIATFLTGAYQEILGDLHNLFGDTDAVNITVSEDGGFSIDHYVPGDTVAEVLNYVQYRKPKMLEIIRKAADESIDKKMISPKEAKLLLRYFEEGLSGYTYLEDE